jgi:hypothetical protein
MSFSREFIDEAEPKMRSILFGLCHFHAIMIERKKFGSKGFNSAHTRAHVCVRIARFAHPAVRALPSDVPVLLGRPAR